MNMPIAPTAELITPNVASGEDDLAAVAMLVAETAPSASPVGIRIKRSENTSDASIDMRLPTRISEMPKT